MNADFEYPRPRLPWPWAIFHPPALEKLGGEFAVQVFDSYTFLTAVGGGGRATDVIHTDAREAVVLGDILILGRRLASGLRAADC